MNQQVASPYGTISLHRPQPNETEHGLVVVPGFSETLTHHKLLVDTLAGIGYDALGYSEPRRNAKPDPILRQAAILSHAIEQAFKDKQRISLVAHSLGSAVALHAASLSPRRFKHIVLMQPVGMAGRLHWLDQMRRISGKIIRDHSSTLRKQHLTYDGATARTPLDKESWHRYYLRIVRAQFASAAVLLSHPVLSIKEAAATIEYDIAEFIEYLTEHGVHVHIITSEKDELFDADKTMRSYQKIRKHVTSYQHLSDKTATHDTVWQHPVRSAQLVKNIIES